MKTNRLESHDVWRYSVFVLSALHTFCSSLLFGKQVKKPHGVSLSSNTVEKENKEKTDPMRALKHVVLDHALSI